MFLKQLYYYYDEEFESWYVTDGINEVVADSEEDAESKMMNFAWNGSL